MYGSTIMDIQDAIKTAPFFSQLSKKDVKQLAAALDENVPGRRVVIGKGKPGVRFFIIASGSRR